MWDMAVPGPTTLANIEQVAANLLKLARIKAAVTQRQLAEAAGVPQSTVARIESGAMQPTLPLLYRLLAAVDLEPRIRVDVYDDHDDVLDRLAARDPARARAAEQARDELLAAAEPTAR
jgi:transcriptional regulator with XRE-family HTH domain